jgi:hypothetical protein
MILTDTTYNRIYVIKTYSTTNFGIVIFVCVGDFDKLIQIVETTYLTKLETKIRDLL